MKTIFKFLIMTFWLYRRGKFYSLKSIWYEAKYGPRTTPEQLIPDAFDKVFIDYFKSYDKENRDNGSN